MSILHLSIKHILKTVSIPLLKIISQEIYNFSKRIVKDRTLNKRFKVTVNQTNISLIVDQPVFFIASTFAKLCEGSLLNLLHRRFAI